MEKAAKPLAVPGGVGSAWRGDAPLNPRNVLPRMKHRGPTQLVFYENIKKCK